MLSGVHPLSTIIFLLGYGLALPIGAKFGAVRASQNRLALIGHQAGVGLAALGWALRASAAMFLVHVLWLLAARIWFSLGAKA